jgi:hypothetical protein
MLVGVERVLSRLFAELVGGQVIALAVGGCGCSVGVCSKIVKLRASIVRALWHIVLLTASMQAIGSAATAHGPM